MAMFHSYVSHIQRVNPIKSHEQPPFSYGFPMDFRISLWSYGLPMVFCRSPSAELSDTAPPPRCSQRRGQRRFPGVRSRPGHQGGRDRIRVILSRLVWECHDIMAKSKALACIIYIYIYAHIYIYIYIHNYIYTYTQNIICVVFNV